MNTDHQVIENADIARLFAEITVDLGSFRLTEGGVHLFEGNFSYSDAFFKPILTYRAEYNIGHLRLAHPKRPGRWFMPKNWQSHWDVQIAAGLPTVLDLNILSGAGRVDLQHMTISELALNINSGEVALDLRGIQPHLQKLLIKLNSGKLHLTMNGTFPHLDIFKIKVNSGLMVADLRGDWSNGIAGVVQVNSGHMTIYTPEKFGVAAKTRSSSGIITTDYLRQVGSAVLVNAAYTNDQPALLLDAQVNSGQLHFSQYEGIAETVTS